MNTIDFRGKPLCELIKVLPAKAAITPVFGRNKSGDRCLLHINAGDAKLLIGDNSYDITPKVYASKSFKKDLKTRIMSPQAHNPNTIWLNEPEVVETKSAW